MKILLQNVKYIILTFVICFFGWQGVALAVDPNPISGTSLISDEHLINYYSLDTDFTDEVGSTNGSDNNVSYVAGKFDNGADSNGTNAFTTLTKSLPSNFTLHFWINYTHKAGNQMAVHNRIGGNAFSAMFNSSDQMDTVVWTTGGSGAAEIFPAITPSSWVGVDIVYDGSDLIVYTDGSETASGALSGTPVVNTSFRYGSADGGDYMDMTLDDIAFFDRALSETEIEVYYAVTLKSGFPVNGVCGSNDGQSFSELTEENANNCSVGVLDNWVYATSTNWTWDCLATGGGNNDNCEATYSSSSPPAEEFTNEDLLVLEGQIYPFYFVTSIFIFLAGFWVVLKA